MEPRSGNDPGPGPPSLYGQDNGDTSQLGLPVHVHVINSDILDQENSGEWLGRHDDGLLRSPGDNHLSEWKAQPHRQPIERTPGVQHTRQWLDTHDDGPLVHPERNTFSGWEVHPQHQPIYPGIFLPNKEPVMHDLRPVPYHHNLEANVVSGIPHQSWIPETNRFSDDDFGRDIPYQSDLNTKQWLLDHSSTETAPKTLDRPHQHPVWSTYQSTETRYHVEKPVVPNVFGTAPSKPIKRTALDHFMKHLLLNALLVRHGVGTRELLPVEMNRLPSNGQTIHSLPPQIPIFEKVSPSEVRRPDARRLIDDYGGLEKSTRPTRGFGYRKQMPNRKKKKGERADK